jgi:predicted choloylglycine hydrolase
MVRNRRLKRGLWFLMALFLISGTFTYLFFKRVQYEVPDSLKSSVSESDLLKITDNYFILNQSWLRLNKYGNWECYIEGNGYERGRTLGILQKELGKQQEKIFLKEIDSKLPSWIYKKSLIIGIAWFNRDLDAYIPKEYRDEIYGISEFFSDEFDNVGPKYNRIINYHAAHDIGHAVQNMHLVDCTAFGKWKFDSSNQEMLMGRNFDFYFGDEFAKNKIVLLSNPDKGYKSISVTWPSFIGVVSGINETGLGITLNSDKSEIPSESGTPVSIIARDVLQYASTIDEAFEICKKYKSFVSESFTISSLKDKKVVVIEKTPSITSIYDPMTGKIVVTNHYQSDALKNDPLNIEHIKNSESLRRFERTKELLDAQDSLNYKTIASILRDQKGLGGVDIGMGNPLAINQLLAHHSVVFDNVKKYIWVSAYPFQLNVMNAYALSDFSIWPANNVQFPITIDSLEIAEDPFYHSEELENFIRFKELREQVIAATIAEKEIDEVVIEEFINENPNYYESYRLVGNYYFSLDKKERAINHYEIALTKEIAYQEDRSFIENRIRELNSND